jgi:hypothetical protein
MKRVMRSPLPAVSASNQFQKAKGSSLCRVMAGIEVACLIVHGTGWKELFPLLSGLILPATEQQGWI